MKNALKYQFSFFNYLVSTQRFKLTFILSVITTIFGVTSLGFETQYGYFDGFLMVLSNPFYMMALYMILFINTVHTVTMFDKNENYIIRCENIKKYIKQMIHKVLFNNTILYIILLLLLMIGLNFFCFGRFHIYVIEEYQIYNIIYLVFFLLRIYVIFLLMAALNVLLLKVLNDKGVILLNILFAIGIVVIPTSGDVITSITKMPFFIGNFLTPHLFHSFLFEILCSLLILFIYSTIVSFLYQFVKKHMRQVGR